MKFEDQILNEPILLISQTCFYLVMDQEMVRRIIPKKETKFFLWSITLLAKIDPSSCMHSLFPPEVANALIHVATAKPR